VNKLFKKNKWTQVIVHVNNNNGWADNFQNSFSPQLDQYELHNDLVYIRLHGTNGQYIGLYSDKFLENIINWIKSKAVKNSLIYFNNTDSVSSGNLADALSNATLLSSKLSYLNLYAD